LTDDEYLAVLSREVKTRRESVEAFRAGGREDLATQEEAEIAIISGYLPEPLTEAEIAALVEEAVGATGATSPRDMGKVMGWLTPRTPRPGRRQARQLARRPDPGRRRSRRARPRPLSTRRTPTTMLTLRTDTSARFTRKEIPRLAIRRPGGSCPWRSPRSSGRTSCAAAARRERGYSLATRDIVAPRARRTSRARSGRKRPRRRERPVPPQYSFRPRERDRDRRGPADAFEARVERIDTRFSTDLTEDGRASLLSDRGYPACPSG
jgi:hypothetical protein